MKSTEEIVLIRYYNVLFYLFFEVGIDDLKRQCLVQNWFRRTNPDEKDTGMVPLSSDTIYCVCTTSLKHSGKFCYGNNLLGNWRTDF